MGPHLIARYVAARAEAYTCHRRADGASWRWLLQLCDLTLPGMDMKGPGIAGSEKVKVIYRCGGESQLGRCQSPTDELDRVRSRRRPDSREIWVAGFVGATGETIGMSLTLPDASFVLQKMKGTSAGIIQALRYQEQDPTGPGVVGGAWCGVPRNTAI